MRIVIVGGHLSPALAVIDALPKDTKILFIGRKYALEGDKALSLEYNTITLQKIPWASVSTGRFQRITTRYTIPSLFKTPYGFIQSFFILRDFKPDVVLSFGGYLSIPVGLSAFFLRIPIVIHEQTLEGGLSNRILSIFANIICISWESSRKYFPKSKTILTGNPLRKFQISNSEFISHGRHSGNPPVGGASRISNVIRDAGQASMTALYDMSEKLPFIYITGGSSGSHFINTLVEGCIEELLKKFIIIHQTGDAQEYRDFDRLSNFKDSLTARLKARYHLVKFVQPQEVGSILERADLIVGRSGINTVTELMFFKKPSLLIPLPYSQNNEQIKNALFLKDKGLGEIFYQAKSGSLTSSDLETSFEFLKVLRRMFDNIDKYRAKYKLVRRSLIKKDAAQKIVEAIYNEAKIK